RISECNYLLQGRIWTKVCTELIHRLPVNSGLNKGMYCRNPTCDLMLEIMMVRHNSTLLHK
ncbi:MAG: hypothetical protein ACRD5E_02815, partial [Nitrososphaeraceae archaeon]